MNISAILPTYNEENNIETAVRLLHKTLLSAAENFEIIVVDDGSNDATEAVVRNMMTTYDSLKIIHHTGNKGYGCAIRSGIAAAVYDWLFIMDADNQFDPEEIKKIIEGAEVTSDALIGYRENRQDSLMRIMSSQVYNVLVRYLFGLKVKDLNCAFKLLRRSVVSRLDIKARFYVINAEILLKLSKSKHSVKEFPVTHYPRKHGRSKVVLKDIVRTFNELRLLKSEKR
jgi:glycosyltransferase involved in cell wall biosynthesis